jgi:hypothetical protein
MKKRQFKKELIKIVRAGQALQQMQRSWQDVVSADITITEFQNRERRFHRVYDRGLASKARAFLAQDIAVRRALDGTSSAEDAARAGNQSRPLEPTAP